MFDFLKPLIDLFYAKHCIFCNKEGRFICQNCFDKIRKRNDQIIEAGNPIQKLYIPCHFHNNPILQKAVHYMKYSFYKDISCELSVFFTEILKAHPPPENSYLVPIPLHKKRQKFRGFNQAKLLTDAVSGKLEIPTIDLLIRTKYTKSQATLNREERIQNMKNVFELNSLVDVPKSTTIILVDDICTTLSTLKEAAKALQKNGYNIIFGMALARAEIKSAYENRN